MWHCSHLGGGRYSTLVRTFGLIWEPNVRISIFLYSRLSLLILLIWPSSGRLGGPALGNSPAPPFRQCLTGAARGGRAAPGFCVCRRWTFPYAGGELAPRGPCPTLVLYLFKRNKPPRSKYTHTLRGRGGCPIIENFIKTAPYFRGEGVPGLRRILYDGTGVSREHESRISRQRSNGC